MPFIHRFQVKSIKFLLWVQPCVIMINFKFFTDPRYPVAELIWYHNVVLGPMP
jgi:hypothetical protein